MKLAHRDIKPANCFLDANLELKLADFGLVEFYGKSSPNFTMKGEVGTDYYMAPELYSGQAYEGPPVDVFASGVTLFIMCTGNFPFTVDKEYTDFHENPVDYCE